MLRKDDKICKAAENKAIFTKKIGHSRIKYLYIQNHKNKRIAVDKS